MSKRRRKTQSHNVDDSIASHVGQSSGSNQQNQERLEQGGKPPWITSQKDFSSSRVHHLGTFYGPDMILDGAEYLGRIIQAVNPPKLIFHYMNFDPNSKKGENTFNSLMAALNWGENVLLDEVQIPKGNGDIRVSMISTPGNVLYSKNVDGFLVPMTREEEQKEIDRRSEAQNQTNEPEITPIAIPTTIQQEEERKKKKQTHTENAISALGRRDTKSWLALSPVARRQMLRLYSSSDNVRGMNRRGFNYQQWNALVKVCSGIIGEEKLKNTFFQDFVFYPEYTKPHLMFAAPNTKSAISGISDKERTSATRGIIKLSKVSMQTSLFFLSAWAGGGLAGFSDKVTKLDRVMMGLDALATTISSVHHIYPEEKELKTVADVIWRLTGVISVGKDAKSIMKGENAKAQALSAIKMVVNKEEQFIRILDTIDPTLIDGETKVALRYFFATAKGTLGSSGKKGF